MKFTASSSRFRLPIMLMAACAAVALGASSGIWLAKGDDGTSQPRLGDLRPAPNLIVLPAQTHSSLGSLLQDASFIAVVKVTGVDSRVTHTFLSEMTGLATSEGRLAVQAEVRHPIVGETGGSATFSQDIFYVPGRPEEVPTIGVTDFAAPLEVGREYLVVVKHGKLITPGGLYAVADGVVRNVGFWDSADTRQYPDTLSGRSVEDASAAIRSYLDSDNAND